MDNPEEKLGPSMTKGKATDQTRPLSLCFRSLSWEQFLCSGDYLGTQWPRRNGSHLLVQGHSGARGGLSCMSWSESRDGMFVFPEAGCSRKGINTGETATFAYWIVKHKGRVSNYVSSYCCMEETEAG